jgi:hypothetical protein
MSPVAPLENSPMNTDEPVVVARVTHPAEAELLRNLLQTEGIVCELGGSHQGGFGGVLEIPVMVRACDAERAQQVLAEHPHKERPE